jgi:DNA-binding SARP family transcriptional activator
MHPESTSGDRSATDERHLDAVPPPVGGHRPLPRARLRPPALRSLRRDRLLRALGAGLGHRLTLVTGPAGSGKTTLLAQFVAHHAGPTTWYRADVDDVAPGVLLDHLARALATVVPDLPRGWRTVDDAVAALDAGRSRPDPDDPAVLLAVDDLHVIVGSEAERALGHLVDALPPWLHLAATCRAAPRWNLSRLRVSGTLFEIGADDLRFRSWEVERLFGDVYREPLPPGDLAQLTRGLEGWAAGLQLFHLATREKPVSERRRAVAALPARSKLVRDYLSGNVLDGLPDAQTTFLVDTSVVGRLTPALCDELRGSTDSRLMLDDLESRQVFVTRLEDDAAYRYHEVFRSYLEGRLVERDGEVGARDRAARAAALLEADGSLADALRAYCRAADWTSVGRVLEKGGAALAADPGDWLDALPRSLVDDDAWVMLAAARRAVATGRFDVALRTYERVDDAQTSATAEAACRRERSALAAWLDPSAAPPPGWTGQLRRALRHRGAPVSVSPPAPGATTGDQFAAGLLSLVQGQVGQATHILTALVDDPATSDVLAAACRLALTVAHALAPGHVAAVAPGELLELVERADVPWLTWMAKAAGAVHGGEAGVGRAREVAGTLERQGDAWGSALARVFAALAAARAGGPGPAELGDLAPLGDDLRGLDAPVLAVWVEAWHASALAVGGRDDEARTLAGDAAAAAARHGLPGARVWALETEAQLTGGPEAAALMAEVETIRRRSAIDVAVPRAPQDDDATTPDDAEPPLPAPAAGEVVPSPAAGEDAGGTTAARPRPVRVRSLGGFSLEVDGQPVDLSDTRPRVRSVLRYLAAQAGRPVHVETMAEALWPDVDASAGKRNLQVALSSLRRLLEAYPPHGRELIRREGPSYALVLPDGSDDDLVTVAAALDAARAEAREGDASGAIAAGIRALTAYGGDLLPEEGPVEWAVERRRSLDSEVVEAAVLVAEQALVAHQPDAAVTACMRGLDIDRYHDGLWRLLERAQVAGGDLAAAARTQERYRKVLSELGVSAP